MTQIPERASSPESRLDLASAGAADGSRGAAMVDPRLCLVSDGHVCHEAPLRLSSPLAWHVSFHPLIALSRSACSEPTPGSSNTIE